MKCFWKHCLAASIALAIGAAAAAEATRPGDKPLVVNGDLSLTTLDFDAYMERVPAELRNEFRAEAAKINPTVDALWVKRVLASCRTEGGRSCSETDWVRSRGASRTSGCSAATTG